MFERSPRLRGLRPRTQQRSPQAPDYKNEMSEINEPGDSVNRSTEDQDRDADTSETLSDDELHIAIRDEQDEPVSDEKSEVDKNYECKTCKTPVGFPTLVEYLQHLRDEHKEKGRSYDCPHCDFVCQHPKSLQEHYNSEHKNVDADAPASEEPTSNQCTMCPYAATNATELETHQRVHHLKRRFFRCTKCTYMTHVRARYTKHVKYHSMPMIKCDDCDFRTPYKWNLDRHTRNHGGGGAFQCRACSFTADIRQSLTVHETNHHEPPVGEAHRRMNTSFDRRLRTGPKRYNQVGASDFRKNDQTEGPATLTDESPGKSPSSDIDGNSIEDRRNAIAGAECIALKCEEKGCQFITAWDSEMQRHLAESHAPSLSPIKRRKPMPMLIPLSPDSDSSAKKTVTNGPRTTPLKVPRVRVRPELARIARDTEIAKLYNNRESGGGGKKETGAADLFEKRNASFFDKLKERLMTTSASITGVSQVAQGTEEIGLEEGVAGEAQIDEPPKKVLITGENHDFSGPPELTPAPGVAENIETNSMSILTALNLRPPPPLKSASRSQGQSLLKTNPSATNAVSILSNNPLSSITNVNSQEEAKRTLWKCKRCNFRSSHKETVLTHVKTHYESTEEATEEGEKNEFTCPDCPYISNDPTAMAIHRIHHRPNLEAIFKCYLCPYYVSTKKELLEHSSLHGEELAVVHQRSIESFSVGSKRKMAQGQSKDNENSSKSELAIEEIINSPTSASSTENSSSVTVNKNNPTSNNKNNGSNENANMSAPPLMLDTRALPDTPLVWVSRTDGTLAKMLKCRHCPYVSSRRVEVRDHETMHVNSSSAGGTLVACPDCSFSCSRRDVMEVHAEMHTGSLGTVHCLVDDGRTDAEQLEDLATLLGLARAPVLGPDPDLRDSRLVYCCSKCPARFLCDKELRIHLRYHSTELAYSCEWCSYAARQPAHLLAHQKAHSSEYQEHTRYLLSMYGNSQRYAPPNTACVESTDTRTRESMDKDSKNEGNRSKVAWIVVDNTTNTISNGSQNYSTNITENSESRGGHQVFTCAKCPARYFKLDALEYHMTLHGSNNCFKCTECDYSSKTAQNLMKHQVVHRRHGESSEPSANRSQQEQAQQRSQGGQQEQDLLDPQLGVAIRGNPNFVYPGSLRNGRIKEKRYKCHKCPSAFEKREQYRVHLTLHGAKQRYRCDKCDYSVKYYANYAQHVKKHQANAQAQAGKRQGESESISVNAEGLVNSDTPENRKTSKNRRKSTISSAPAIQNVKNGISASTSVGLLQPSNQDKQSVLLMKKKGACTSSVEDTSKMLRCLDCPFSSSDKDAMDSHKRRHGIERLTPPCPHCNYVPRKDENVGEHIRLHFTRLYKPESYLIVELLTLTMRPLLDDKKDSKIRNNDILFRECKDGKYLPTTENNLLPPSGSSSVNGYQEKVIVDPNTVKRSVCNDAQTN
ncbi:zinc finger protein Xfin-like isoform X5 [Venturia canescens]|uniref:zinc finger protein Xfin-like isoform X5 n=1 Tax=Venturia canescens TaxID=32260 RepID=UPI001C9D2ECD|nr:zinc finger protein Xfin-like isoform X5 [Venturia canescens]